MGAFGPELVLPDPVIATRVQLYAEKVGLRHESRAPVRAVITSRVAVRTPTRDLRTVETIGPGRYYLSITPASPEACAYVLTQAWLLGTPVAWAYGASGSLEVAWVLGASGERALDILLAQKEVAADWSLIDLNALLARAIPVLFKPSSKYFRPQMRASEFVAMVRP